MHLILVMGLTLLCSQITAESTADAGRVRNVLKRLGITKNRKAANNRKNGDAPDKNREPQSSSDPLKRGSHDASHSPHHEGVDTNQKTSDRHSQHQRRQPAFDPRSPSDRGDNGLARQMLDASNPFMPGGGGGGGLMQGAGGNAFSWNGRTMRAVRASFKYLVAPWTHQPNQPIVRRKFETSKWLRIPMDALRIMNPSNGFLGSRVILGTLMHIGIGALGGAQLLSTLTPIFLAYVTAEIVVGAVVYNRSSYFKKPSFEFGLKRPISYKEWRDILTSKKRVDDTKAPVDADGADDSVLDEDSAFEEAVRQNATHDENGRPTGNTRKSQKWEDRTSGMNEDTTAEEALEAANDEDDMTDGSYVPYNWDDFDGGDGGGGSGGDGGGGAPLH